MVLDAGSLLDIVLRHSTGYPLEEATASRIPHGIEAIVVAIGKSGLRMAKALEDAKVKILGGVVVVPRGYPGKPPQGLERVDGSHPVPDEGSLRAGEAALEWARQARGSRLLALISGGGSALAEAPVDPLTLEDLVETTRLLLASGATIHEINAVRKHLSRIKGGRLAEAAYPGEVLGLYASDVPGDRLDSIASGPTVPDPTTYRDAVEVINRYGLADAVPARVMRVLEEGATGARPETPKPGSRVFQATRNELVASNMDVLKRIAGEARRAGMETMILTSRLEGESREAGRILASIAMESIERGVPLGRPAAILAGGETTVRVRNPHGRGGRNMELALSWALSMRYWGYTREAMIVSIDTDGVDGSTNAAGAYMIPGDVDAMRGKGVDPARALDENNTLEPIEAVGRLVYTGPTQVNLNSVTAIFIPLDGVEV